MPPTAFSHPTDGASSHSAGHGGPAPGEWLEAPLPRLRNDLKLFPGPVGADGAPTHTIYDPVRHRYFQVGRAGTEFLAAWTSPSGGALLQTIATTTTLKPSPQDLAQFIAFLRTNNLLHASGEAAIRALTEQTLKARQGWAQWLLHHYLFIRLPLCRPDRFLKATLPWARRLLNHRFILAVMALGAVGGLLALRQWDHFLHTFQNFFSLEGAAAFGITLAAVKICHELGHAYTARHFGCRVPTMGVAFVVLVPMLYTDVSDAWRLPSRRQRLLIGAAGVLTELGLALIATFLWSFLPEGPLRSAAFLVATTTWLTSVAINASPFMRFDGYYLLADWLGIANLQPRSFAMARWRLREVLFGFGDPPPEPLAPRTRLILILYAWVTWAYRLFLFLGIALLVYYFFIKVVGIILFAVEVGWFIALPILRELAEWRRRRRDVRLNRHTAATLAGLVLLMAAAVVPWQTRVSVPATLQAVEHAALFPPAPARIADILASAGDSVAAGSILYRLESPDLEFRLQAARERQRLLELQIDRQAGSADDLANLTVLREQLAAAISAEAGYQAEKDRLILRAPIDGVLRDVPPHLHAGLWVKADQPLGLILGQRAAGGTAELRGYVAAPDLERIAVGAAGRFIPEDVARPALDAVVSSVAQVNVAALDTPMLASTQGGPVAVLALNDPRRPQGTLVPATTLYRVTLRPTTALPTPAQIIPGTVLVEGEAQNLLLRLWRGAVAVLVRESGF
ncbi:site-2 protease family protein [Azospirillum picis]|uniref:Peptide zinc metalloprotease protein n=1 Tax=Azospirillum picis TaxID=488438 RepID=A0ABU0MRM7_9PROT|nr:site-2 protease family protein [Azospirillum picis]MBP2300819.1 putative peptide zinc metalloprotease protein [Azospirillum picis]MDQ0536076.1 putative peptide zinc metalloprotease protein [Azospirillum picis]